MSRAGFRRWVALCAAAAVTAGLVATGGSPAAARTSVAIATSWDQLQADVANGGTVQLGADIVNTDGENLAVGSTPVTLDLAGQWLVTDDSDTEGLAGIEVGPGASLTIVDSVGGGSLDASGGTGAAGIGGNGTTRGGFPETGGSVTISGGTVVATGGESSGAGIGGGADGDGGCESGFRSGPSIQSVTVTGGSVIATGGDDAAGIGGADCMGAGSTVTVSGGSVQASGGYDAAGIGGGWDGDGGSLSVSGGAVTATGGYQGAGVGGGVNEQGGSLTVSGGAVTASGGDGAAGAGGGAFDGPGSAVTVDSGGSLSASNGADIEGEGTGPSAIGAGEDATDPGSLTNAGTVTIPSGAVLKVPAGQTVTNSGTMQLNGELGGTGTVANSGAILGSGTVDGAGRGPAGSALEVDGDNVTLSFDANSAAGTNPAPVQVFADTVADGNAVLPADPSPSSAGNFLGWFTAPTGGTLVTNSTQLTTALGGSGPLSATLHAQYAPTGPSVTGLSPATGPISGGTALTITGTGLTGTRAVSFGGVAAASFQVVSDTQVRATTPAHPSGTVQVRIATPLGVSPVVPADQYAFGSAITQVTPAAGPLTGGTRMTIAGTGFTGASAVTVAGVPVASFTVVSPTRITAVAPAGSAGPADVTVTGPGGTATASGAFSYVAPPAITALSVTGGPTCGGSTLTITGSDFTGATSVFVGSAASIVSTSPTQLTVTTPAHAAGVVSVRVAATGGVSALVTADQYTFGTTVTQVVANSGPVTGGSTVTINGDGFGGASAVSVGGVPAQSFTVVSPTKITAVTPAGTAGPADVAVITPNGTGTKTGAFTYVAAPTITSMSPCSGSTAGGTAITVTGTGFSGTRAVTVGSGATFTVLSDTQLLVVTPAHAAGVANVRVATAGGTSAVSAADRYTFTSPPARRPNSQ